VDQKRQTGAGVASLPWPMAKYVSLLSFPAFWPTIGPWKSWFNRAEVAAAKTGTGHADWFGFQTEEKKNMAYVCTCIRPCPAIWSIHVQLHQQKAAFLSGLKVCITLPFTCRNLLQTSKTSEACRVQASSIFVKVGRRLEFGLPTDCRKHISTHRRLRLLTSTSLPKFMVLMACIAFILKA